MYTRVCLLRSAESSSPDNASIVARLDGDDSGEASLGIIRFVPISSPSRLPSAFLLRRLLPLVPLLLLLLFQSLPLPTLLRRSESVPT